MGTLNNTTEIYAASDLIWQTFDKYENLKELGLWVTLPAFLVLGVVGNLTTFYILVYKWQLQSTFTFMTALLFATQTLKCITLIPMTLFWGEASTNRCRAQHAVYNFFFFSTSFLLAFSFYDRYKMSKKPSKIVSYDSAKFKVAGALTGSICLSLPILLSPDNEGSNDINDIFTVDKCLVMQQHIFILPIKIYHGFLNFSLWLFLGFLILMTIYICRGIGSKTEIPRRFITPENAPHAAVSYSSVISVRAEDELVSRARYESPSDIVELSSIRSGVFMKNNAVLSNSSCVLSTTDLYSFCVDWPKETAASRKGHAVKICASTLVDDVSGTSPFTGIIGAVTGYAGQPNSQIIIPFDSDSGTSLELLQVKQTGRKKDKLNVNKTWKSFFTRNSIPPSGKEKKKTPPPVTCKFSVTKSPSNPEQTVHDESCTEQESFIKQLIGPLQNSTDTDGPDDTRCSVETANCLSIPVSMNLVPSSDLNDVYLKQTEVANSSDENQRKKSTKGYTKSSAKSTDTPKRSRVEASKFDRLEPSYSLKRTETSPQDTQSKAPGKVPKRKSHSESSVKSDEQQSSVKTQRLSEANRRMSPSIPPIGKVSIAGNYQIGRKESSGSLEKQTVSQKSTDVKDESNGLNLETGSGAKPSSAPKEHKVSSAVERTDLPASSLLEVSCPVDPPKDKKARSIRIQTPSSTGNYHKHCRGILSYSKSCVFFSLITLSYLVSYGPASVVSQIEIFFPSLASSVHKQFVLMSLQIFAFFIDIVYPIIWALVNDTFSRELQKIFHCL